MESDNDESEEEIAEIPIVKRSKKGGDTE